MKSKKSVLILRICLTAMFLALAVVSKLFLSINIPLLGAGGMRVGMAGVFTAFPAFLFGPVYGGVTSALSDVLGYLVKPDGAYIPWLTLTAFLGGFLKGLIWMGIMKLAKRDSRTAQRIRVCVLAVLIVIGSLGVVSTISLNRDNVLNGLWAEQSALPTRGQVDSLDARGVTKVIVGLARYNNDTLTLKAVDPAAAEDSVLTVPSTVTLDGYTAKLTKTASGCFAACADVGGFCLPSTLTTIDDGSFGDLADVTVITAEGSKAADFAAGKGYPVTYLTEEDGRDLALSSDSFAPDGTGVTATDGLWTVRSSDTYRKYLAGYANFATIGLELIALAGILFVLLDYLLERLSKGHTPYGQPTPRGHERPLRADGPKPAPGGWKRGKISFMMIFVAIFLSGLVVTTINTEILKHVMAAWNGRQFMVLWIPRAIEEMVVCLVQAYLISLLYGVYNARFAGRGRFAALDRNYREEERPAPAPAPTSEPGAASESGSSLEETHGTDSKK